MNLLNKHIDALLRKNDCVIIPGFGGFITSYRPAFVNEALQRVEPPSKNILFNVELANDDGLLVAHIASAEEKTYSEVRTALQKISDEYANLLNNNKRINFNFGALYKDANQQIRFMPNRRINFLSGSYGMSAVYPESIGEKRAERASSIRPLPIVERANREKKKFYLPKVAVVGAFLMYYVGWVAYHQPQISQASFSSAYTTPLYSERVSIPEFELEEFLEASIKLNNEALATENNAVEGSKNTIEPIAVAVKNTSLFVDDIYASEFLKSSYSFHIIGGSFSELANAANLVNQVRNNGASVASVLEFKNNLYRVALGSYSSLPEAQKSLKEFQESGRSCWLLK